MIKTFLYAMLKVADCLYSNDWLYHLKHKCMYYLRKLSKLLQILDYLDNLLNTTIDLIIQLVLFSGFLFH